MVGANLFFKVKQLVFDHRDHSLDIEQAGNTKWGSITVPLTSFLTGLDWSVLQI